MPNKAVVERKKNNTFPSGPGDGYIFIRPIDWYSSIKRYLIYSYGRAVA